MTAATASGGGGETVSGDPALMADFAGGAANSAAPLNAAANAVHQALAAWNASPNAKYTGCMADPSGLINDLVSEWRRTDSYVLTTAQQLSEALDGGATTAPVTLEDLKKLSEKVKAVNGDVGALGTLAALLGGKAPNLPELPEIPIGNQDPGEITTEGIHDLAQLYDLAKAAANGKELPGLLSGLGDLASYGDEAGDLVNLSKVIAKVTTGDEDNGPASLIAIDEADKTALPRAVQRIHAAKEKATEAGKEETKEDQEAEQKAEEASGEDAGAASDADGAAGNADGAAGEGESLIGSLEGDAESLGGDLESAGEAIAPYVP